MGVIGKLFGNEKEFGELRQKNADLVQKLSNYEKVIQEMQKKNFVKNGKKLFRNLWA